MTNGIITNVLNNSSILGTENNVKSLSSMKENEGEKDFASVLQNAILNSLEDTQSYIDHAEREEIRFALGQSDSTHELMIAQNKANLAVSYTVAVRDRFLDAYKEIMNMQV